MAITTFVGQNIGARKYKRVKKGIFAAWVMSSLIILAGSVVMYFGAPLLISVFTNEPQARRPARRWTFQGPHALYASWYGQGRRSVKKRRLFSIYAQ